MRTQERLVEIGGRLVRQEDVAEVDVSCLEFLEVSVVLRSGARHDLRGQEALNFCMRTNPSVLEGRRFRFARHAWAFHNIVAHPLMQILAWVGRPDLGIRVHDATVPRPRGIRSSSGASRRRSGP